MRALLVERKGWRYLNTDLRPDKRSSSVCADAHLLPFKDAGFSLVIAKDALEHFEQPWRAVSEIRCVLMDGGTLVIWVPFMWPFHGDDFYRYTPLAFEKLLNGFKVHRFSTPLWVFSVMGLAMAEIAKRMGAGALEGPIREVAWRLDRLLQPRRDKPRSFAAAYLIVAIKAPS